MCEKLRERNHSLISLMLNVCGFAESEVTCSMGISVQNNFPLLSASI